MDFYFDCKKLNARILSSACERNRTHKPKTNEFNLRRECKKCGDWQCYQEVQIPVQEVHTEAMIHSANNPPKPKKETRHFWR